MTDRPEFRPRHRSLWHMILAPTVWAVHFTLTYATIAIWCAKLGTVDGLRLVIAALALIAFGIIAFLGWRGWRQWDYLDDNDYVHGGATDEDRREFLGHTGFLLAVISAIGTLYVALPALWIETCA